MIFSRAFRDFMATGKKPTEAMAEDAAPGSAVDLKAHDARFHGGHYDGKGSCKYREALAKGDKTDDLAKAERDEERAKKTSKDIADALAAVTGSGAQFFDVPEGSRGEFAFNIISWSKTPFSENSFDGGGRNKDGSWTAHVKNKALAKPLADWLNHAFTNVKAVADDGDVTISDKGAQSEIAANAPTTQDYRDLADIRDRLERVARLLNGRAGNLAALQASSRWKALDNYTNSPDIARLGQLGASSDKALAKAANTLSQVARNIVLSKMNGWTTTAGMVPPASAMPKASGQQQAGAPQGGHAAHKAHKPSAHGGGHGGGAVKKGPWSGKTLTPFMAPSAFEAQLKAINANHPALKNANWYSDEANKLTPQQAVADMEARGDIVKGGYRDTFDANDPDERELWAGWRPSKKLSDETAKMASVVFADIKKRFPGVAKNWKNNMDLRCGEKAFTGGQSVHTASWSRHAVLWNYDGKVWGGVGLGKSNYGHTNPGWFGRDVLAHELGHSFMSDMLPNGKRKMSLFHKVLNDNWGDDAKELWDWGRKYLSAYSVTDKGHGPSAAEFLAEATSLFSSPDYQPSYLPEPIETFIATEIFGLQKPTTP